MRPESNWIMDFSFDRRTQSKRKMKNKNQTGKDYIFNDLEQIFFSI